MHLSEYRIMWVFVFFDLPTEDKVDKYHYRKFHDYLLKKGFDMHQYSVYIRPTTGIQHRDQVISNLERNLPPRGDVSILYVTDKQFGMIKNFYMAKHEPPPEKRSQIMMF
jgi:CRISPR-associated protein Cas2